MNCGICIVALGHEIYGSMAFNLVMGMKAYEPLLKVAILHNDSSIAHLTPEELNLFDHKIRVDDSDFIMNGKKYYARMKLCVNKYTPFDLTILMDADNIWHPFKKVSHLFGEAVFRDFMIQMNGFYSVKKGTRTNGGYTYWGEPKDMASYHGISEIIPQTVSGFFSFKKGDYSDKVFKLSLEAFDDVNAPCLPWAGARPDEYGFNVALGKLNHKFETKHVFYFEHLHGSMPNDRIYNGFWGTATGGAIVPEKIKIIYNKLVEKYCLIHKIQTRRWHIDKAKVLPERNKK